MTSPEPAFRLIRQAICGLLVLLAGARGEDVSLPGGALRVELDSAGAVASLHLGDETFASPAAGFGLFVRDGVHDELLPVGLGSARDRETVIAQAGLRVVARLESAPDHLLVTGFVEDTRRTVDRSADVVVRLPFAPALWWNGISGKTVTGATSTRVAPAQHTNALAEGGGVLEKLETTGIAQNYFPLACVTTPDEHSGLALAIPPNSPCRFRFAYRPEFGSFELQFLFGLSQAASEAFKGRAPFRFLIFPADGHWGFRDAVRQYHAFYPEVFTRRTTASGLWLVSMPSLQQVTNPELYAFWQATRLSETSLAAKLGLGAFPYTIVGQRELGYLKHKPANYDEVLATLATKPESTHRSRYTWEEVKPAVESSGLRDPEGRLIYRQRDTEWAGTSVSFPMNPSPFLPATPDHPTAASHTLAEVERALREHPELAGFFVDSLGMWGSYENYRRDHFAAIGAPLAHDAEGLVCLPNWMPHVDYLRELHRRIGDRLVFGNGARPGRAFCGFELDVLGVEFSMRDFEIRTEMDCLRAMAGPKPALALLDYPEEGLSRAQAEEYVPRFVALGLAPEMRRAPWPRYQERDADLYAKFMPVYRRLDRAGWQPVTKAAASPDVWIERFGMHPPELYFSVYNPDATPVSTEVIIDRVALGLAAGIPADEIVENQHHLDLAQPITLPPHGLRVIHFGD